MTQFSSVPDEISHKELNSLLVSATKDAKRLDIDVPGDVNSKEEEFKLSMLDWAEKTRNLLSSIQAREPKVIGNLNSNQAMALGALEVHLTLALQAHSAIKKDF